MGKYVPKNARNQCIHVYQSNFRDKKKGQRCSRKGTMDKDGCFRCTWHRYISHELRKKENREKRSRRIIERLKKKGEMEGSKNLDKKMHDMSPVLTFTSFAFNLSKPT
jgi:hypothetical protein